MTTSLLSLERRAEIALAADLREQERILQEKADAIVESKRDHLMKCSSSSMQGLLHALGAPTDQPAKRLAALAHYLAWRKHTATPQSGWGEIVPLLNTEIQDIERLGTQRANDILAQNSVQANAPVQAHIVRLILIFLSAIVAECEARRPTYESA